MKSYKWEPQEIEVEIIDDTTGEVKKETKPSPFTGFVELDIPKYRKRLEYIKSCNFQVTKDGTVDMGGNFDSIIKLIDIAEKHVKKVELVRKEDNMEFKSFEMLEDDSEGSELLGIIGNKILEGVKLGNG